VSVETFVPKILPMKDDFYFEIEHTYQLNEPSKKLLKKLFYIPCFKEIGLN